MSKVIINEEKINQLTQYYKDKKLLIIGLNDSQGVNTTSAFFKKGLLEYIASSLTTDELTPQVINAFSLVMNKTEHIDYFFNNNLSLEEIKLSQVYSAVSALEKVMTDTHLPKFLANIGYIYKLIYKPNIDDYKIYISIALKNSNEPILIYSSGVNNLMREIGANPFSIKKDYKYKEIKPNYNYTLQKVKNSSTLNSVIDSIERNYNTILSINSNTDIYTLGAYIPKSLQNEHMTIFNNLILEYNEKLLNLCNKYKITFIDTEKIGKDYNNSEYNFHITTSGHYAVAQLILDKIYENKIILNKTNNFTSNNPFIISNKGVKGIIEATLSDSQQSTHKSINLFGYAKSRELAIAEEHKREAEIFKKVLSKLK